MSFRAIMRRMGIGPGDVLAPLVCLFGGGWVAFGYGGPVAIRAVGAVAIAGYLLVGIHERAANVRSSDAGAARIGAARETAAAMASATQAPSAAADAVGELVGGLLGGLGAPGGHPGGNGAGAPAVPVRPAVGPPGAPGAGHGSAG